MERKSAHSHLDGQAPTRAIEHDTFHNDAHSIKELLWNAFHICPVAIAITYGKSIENKDRFENGGRSMKGQTSNPKVPAKFDRSTFGVNNKCNSVCSVSQIKYSIRSLCYHSLLIWCSVTAFLEQVAGVFPVAFSDSAVVWYARSTFYLSQPCNGHKGLHPSRVCLRWKEQTNPPGVVLWKCRSGPPPLKINRRSPGYAGEAPEV